MAKNSHSWQKHPLQAAYVHFQRLKGFCVLFVSYILFRQLQGHAMPRRNAKLLTQLVIKAAKPRERDYLIRDAAVTGFALRVWPSGTKKFVSSIGMQTGEPVA